MKTKQRNQINLIEGGKDTWEETDEYKGKVSKIIQEVTDKYSTTLLNETNWIRRLLIKLRVEIAIRKKINELSSLKNLHTIDSSALYINFSFK